MSAKLRGCEICRKPIEPERLEIPDTRLCRAHAEKVDQYGGEFLLLKEVERTSKPGSLKRNYGGVSVTSRRNTVAIEKARRDYEEEQSGSRA